MIFPFIVRIDSSPFLIPMINSHYRLVSALCFAPIIAMAEETKEEKSMKIKTAWEHTAATGFGFTSGNSESLTYSLQFLGTYRDDESDISYGADYFFAEYSGFKSTDSLNIFGNYNRNISKKFYAGTAATFYTNSVADINYRADLSAYLGYYFFRTDKKLFSIEFGSGYALEDKAGISDGFITYRAAQHFDYKFKNSATLHQSAVLTPKATDPSSYLFTFEAGIDVRLRGQWGLRATLNHRIDLDPAPGSEQDDTILTVGLSYSLNGFLEAKKDRADSRKTLKKKVEKKEGAPQGWLRNAAITTGLAQGNSDNLSFKFDYDTAFRSKTNEFFLKGSYQYAESDGARAQNRLNASSRYNWKFGPRNYVGVGTRYLYDELSRIDYRIAPGVHAGRYFILNNSGGFSLEAGLAATHELRDGIEDTYLTVQAAQRLYWQIGYHTFITQEISYDAPIDDPATFNINSYLYLDTILSETFAWRVGVEYYLNSTPAEGADRNDFSFTTGISVRF